MERKKKKNMKIKKRTKKKEVQNQFSLNILNVQNFDIF